jgi:hypothetical protein
MYFRKVRLHSAGTTKQNLEFNMSIARAQEALRMVEEGKFYQDYDASSEALGHLRTAVDQMQSSTGAAKDILKALSTGEDPTAAMTALQVACGLKSSHGWLADREGLVLMDPDGWDRENLEASMAELITKDEFELRLMMSTSMVQRETEPEPGM